MEADRERGERWRQIEREASERSIETGVREADREQKREKERLQKG
jgi:hypothetical protein